MRIQKLGVTNFQSHKASSITFDRPVSVLYGLNSAGKSSLARAIGFLLRGSASAVEGSRAMPPRRLIRHGEDAAEITGQIVRRDGEAPVEVVRRLTTRGLTTRVQGKEVTKDAFDFYTPPGIADPASVFKVLADTDGLFDMDGENQKILLLSLVEQSVPGELTDPLPLHRIGKTIRSFADLDEAYEASYKARTAANAKHDALRVVVNPGTTERPELEAIRTKLSGLREEERRLVGQAGEQKGERTTLEQERADVVTKRDQAALRLQELGTLEAIQKRIRDLDTVITQATATQTERSRQVAAIAGIRGERDGLQKQRDGLAKLAKSAACPTCAKPLTAEERKKQDAVWAGQLEDLDKDIDQREKALPKVPDTKKTEELKTAAVRIQEGITHYGSQRQTAETRLAEIDARLAQVPKTATGPSPELETLRTRITNGEGKLREAETLVSKLDDYAQYTERAAELDAELAELNVLVKHLGAKGLKERLLTERIGALQTKVNRVLTAFRLQVEYAQDPWEIRVNGVPSRLMATSEAFRAGIAHQVAIAAVTGARICVVDGMDLLDRDNRTALLQILEAAIAQKILDQVIAFATFVTPPAPSTVDWATHFLVELSGDGSVIRRL